MSGFAYLRPATLAEAQRALVEEGSVAVAGGTGLLPAIDDGLDAPSRVVDVRDVPELAGITTMPDGGLRVGGAVRIAEIAGSEEIRDSFPLLARAAASVGSPALREMGTLGGNLAQRQHCWYLRSRVKCFKNGGTSCAAVEGEHAYHAIIGSGTCHAVHPSDPAVALDALDATVITSQRRLSISQLFEGAAENPRGETVLARDELILAVVLPASSRTGVQHWEKIIQRGAFDFALVSCAAMRRADGIVRISLGGVAAGPWRAPLSVEEDVASGGLEDDSLDALAERALYDARPLPGSAYKVRIAQELLRRAMRALGSRNPD